MAKIYRGTTPTLMFTFNAVKPSDISVAILSIKQHDETVLTKDLTDAIVDTKSISWILSQEETLALKKVDTEIMCDWKLNTGIRGYSEVLKAGVSDSGKDEVI